MSKTCENCKYFAKAEMDRGAKVLAQMFAGLSTDSVPICRRNPMPLGVSLDHWCGEYRPKDTTT